MSHLADHSSRSLTITSGEGVWLTDQDGKRYLDFLAGWCVANIGYKHPRAMAAMREIAENPLYVPPVMRYPGWEEFAKILIKIAPGERLKRAYRCTSGSEAVEFALKCARAATGKPNIISVDGVYHGHTYGAMAVGDACGNSVAPCPQGFLKIPLPHKDFGSDSERSFEAFMHIVETRNDIAAFFTEPVWTNAGSYVPDSDFLPRIEAECRKRGILFIMDEVATGFGRCGRLFASELWRLEPDIICLGKGMTGGYSTMGATLVSESVFRRSASVSSYSTFGWAPNDLSVAKAVVETIVENRLWEQAEKLGVILGTALKKHENHGQIGEVRGIGLLHGVSIVGRILGTPAYLRAQLLQNRFAKNGLILETAGTSLFITPPLTISNDELLKGISILDKLLK